MSKKTNSTMPTPDKIREYAVCPAAFREDLLVRVISKGKSLFRFGELQAEFQRCDFAAMDDSLIALAKGEEPPKRRFWWERTKKASKDSDLAMQVQWALAFASWDMSIQIGAEDQEQANEIRLRIVRSLRANRWLREILHITKDAICNPKNGATCTILTSDEFSAHGSIPDWLIVNELSHLSNRGYVDNLFDNVYGVSHALLSIATNAGHLDSWQYKMRETIRESDLWVFSAYSQPAPWHDAKYLALRQKESGGNTRFLRLWHGVWGLDREGALSADAVRRCITLDRPVMIHECEGRPFIASLDLGRTRDHSALVVMNYDPYKETFALAYCRSWKPPEIGQPIDTLMVKRECLRVMRKYNPIALVYDPAEGGEDAAQYLRAETGVPTWLFEFKNPSLRQLAASVLLEVFAERRIQLYDDPDLIRDLFRLEIKEGKTGGFSITSNRDDEHGHADRGIAMTMLLAFTASSFHAVARYCEPAEEIYITT
jgi:hypothetical protein